jgi:hypothetical protein
LTLVVVRDLRAVTGPEKLVAFETDAPAGFVLVWAGRRLTDGTISSGALLVLPARS